jgi:hypothetical protein
MQQKFSRKGMAESGLEQLKQNEYFQENCSKYAAHWFLSKIKLHFANYSSIENYFRCKSCHREHLEFTELITVACLNVKPCWLDLFKNRVYLNICLDLSY